MKPTELAEKPISVIVKPTAVTEKSTAAVAKQISAISPLKSVSIGAQKPSSGNGSVASFAKSTSINTDNSASAKPDSSKVLCEDKKGSVAKSTTTPQVPASSTSTTPSATETSPTKKLNLSSFAAKYMEQKKSLIRPTLTRPVLNRPSEDSKVNSTKAGIQTLESRDCAMAQQHTKEISESPDKKIVLERSKDLKTSSGTCSKEQSVLGSTEDKVVKNLTNQKSSNCKDSNDTSIKNKNRDNDDVPEPSNKKIKLDDNISDKSKVIKEDNIKQDVSIGKESGAKSNSDVIIEPVMIITGAGEGSKCDAGNPLFGADDTSVADSSSETKPWWECFDDQYSKEEDSYETIEEPVLYVWGEGAGAECLAGNSGDEAVSTPARRGRKQKATNLVSKDEDEEKQCEDDATPEEKNGDDNTSIKDLSLKRNLRNVSKQSKDTEINGLKTDSEIKSISDDQESTVEAQSVIPDEVKEVSNTEEKESDSITSSTGENDASVTENSTSKAEIDTSKTKSVEDGMKNNDLPTDVADNVKCNNHTNDTKEENGDGDCIIEGKNEDPLASAETTEAESSPVKKGRGRPKKRGGPGRPSWSRPQSQAESGAEESASPPRKRVKQDLSSELAMQEDTSDQGGRRRGSARIAKIREKELEDRAKQEGLRLQELAEESKMKELYKQEREERRDHRDKKKDKREKKDKDKDKEKDKDKVKKKRKKKRKHKRKPNDPWASSSSSSEEEEEEEEEEEFSEEDLELVFKSDHEFSPESDLEEADMQPVKRARTAGEGKLLTDKSSAEAVAIDAAAAAAAMEEKKAEEATRKEEDDTSCEKCGHEDHPETILLCDLCDHGWHLSCLRPPLLVVPEGDWTCPDCQHMQLILRLKQLLNKFDMTQKQAESLELQKQRLEYVNVSLQNVIKKKKHDGGRDRDSYVRYHSYFYVIVFVSKQ